MKSRFHSLDEDALMDELRKSSEFTPKNRVSSRSIHDTDPRLLHDRYEENVDLIDDLDTDSRFVGTTFATQMSPDLSFFTTNDRDRQPNARKVHIRRSSNMRQMTSGSPVEVLSNLAKS